MKSDADEVLSRRERSERYQVRYLWVFCTVFLSFESTFLYKKLNLMVWQVAELLELTPQVGLRISLNAVIFGLNFKKLSRLKLNKKIPTLSLPLIHLYFRQPHFHETLSITHLLNVVWRQVLSCSLNNCGAETSITSLSSLKFNIHLKRISPHPFTRKVIHPCTYMFRLSLETFIFLHHDDTGSSS